MVPQVEDDIIDQMLEIKNQRKMVVIKFYLHYENDWISWHKGTPENCMLLQCKRIYGICLIELEFLNMNY